MKSRGEILHDALVSAAEKGDVGILDRAAAEYDRLTRAELPEDVETFVQDLETRLAAHGPAVTYSIGADTIPRLIAIVREQGTELARSRQADLASSDRIEQFVAPWRSATRAMFAERDALRERLAKFETCIVCEAFLLPPDIPPHCEDSCIVEEEHEAEWEAFCRRAERCTDDT